MNNQLPKVKHFAVTWPNGEVTTFRHRNFTDQMTITEEYVKGILLLRDRTTREILKPLKVKRTK